MNKFLQWGLDVAAFAAVISLAIVGGVAIVGAMVAIVYGQSLWLVPIAIIVLAAAIKSTLAVIEWRWPCS